MAQLGSANNGETGSVRYNIPGNQRKLTGNPDLRDELTIMGWWCGDNVTPAKPLVLVARFKDEECRQRCADAVSNACENPNIGYDQSDRNSLRNRLIALGGVTVENFSKINIPCNCDCSSLTVLCIMAACGVDLGSSQDTGSLLTTLRKRSDLFEFPPITEPLKLTGFGTLPGDIIVWRNFVIGKGHAAIVVTSDDSYVPPVTDSNVFGITNVVLNNDELYGQTSSYKLSDTKGTLKIAFNVDDKIKYATKVVAVDQFGIRHNIFGEFEDFSSNVFIGDYRIHQLDEYNLFQSKDIFYDDRATVSQTFALLKIIKQAANKNYRNCYFWIGINDIFSYENKFFNFDEHGQIIDINTDYCDEWLFMYKELVESYIDNHKNKDEFKTNKINKVTITSICSTSKNYKYHYDEQVELINYLNQLLSDWVEEEQQGNPPEDCWLQFVELYNNAQNSENQINFETETQFTKQWYINNFLPKFNFAGFLGEN